MTKIAITKSPADLRKGLRAIEAAYPAKFGSKGYKLTFKADPALSSGGLTVTRRPGGAGVRYGRAVDAFRALGMILGEDTAARKKDVVQRATFDTLGLMIDASRNGVSTVETVEQLLVRSALMGINVCMMYTEDTYEVPGEPFFGYLRGAYSKKEMKGLDDFAFSLGIEMFPCIQALAHLEQILQWPAYKEYQDNHHILLPEDKKTYVLVEKMIKAASAPFRSKRIHLGMDEAHGLGQGRFKQLKGEKRSFDIMNTHLTKVRNICKKLGLKPIIWSDMYFRLGSRNGGYYDKDWSIPKDVVKNIPKDVQLVYWDYYHTDYPFYCEWIDRHRGLGSEPIVAPGAWTWNHFWADLDFAERSLTPCMEACRDKGIKEVILTCWGDNGMECDIYSALPAFQLFAEFGYTDKISSKALADNFKGSCDADYKAWFKAAKLDVLPGVRTYETQTVNPSKPLLYGDVLLGLWEKDMPTKGMNRFYGQLAESLFASAKGTADKRLKFPAQIAKVLSIKCELRAKLVAAYKGRKKAQLKKLLNTEVKDLRREVDKLWKTHRAMWLETYKPFGLEVIEMRYGALRTRLATLADRLSDYISGKVKDLPEFETAIQRIYDLPRGQIQHVGAYKRIVSPSCIV